MNIVTPRNLLLTGVAALAWTTTTALVARAPVHAQTRADVTRPDQRPATGPNLRGSIDARRAGPASPATPATDQDAPATDGAVVDGEPDPSRITDVRGQLAPRAPADPDMAPGSTDDSDPDPDVGDGAQRIVSRRPQDGDLAEREPVRAPDGEVLPEQAQMPVDGDIGLVEALAAGEDEQAPGVPDSPGRPVTARKYGPYQPVGMRVGSFIFYPEAELASRFTDNLFHSSTGKKSEIGLEVRPGARLESNWRQHAVELRVVGGQTFYNQFSSENDNRLDAQARARFDFSRRSNLQTDLGYSFGQDSRGSVNVSSTLPERPNVIVKTASVALNHRINRIILQLRGGETEYDYSTVSGVDAAGVLGVLSGPGRNYKQHEIGGRAGYAFTPGFTAFTDASLNERRHETASLSDGIARDSNGNRVRAGVALNIRGNLQGEASIGFARQTPDDQRLKQIEGLIFDGAVNWQPTGLTEIKFTAKSDVTETTIAHSAGALTRQTGIEVRHALQRNLILVAGLSYSVADYAGTPLRETDLIAQAGAEYYLSRELVLVGDIKRDHFETNTPGRNFDENIVRVGVRVRR